MSPAGVAGWVQILSEPVFVRNGPVVPKKVGVIVLRSRRLRDPNELWKPERNGVLRVSLAYRFCLPATPVTELSKWSTSTTVTCLVISVLRDGFRRKPRSSGWTGALRKPHCCHQKEVDQAG